MWNPFSVVDASHDDPTIYPTLSSPDASLPFETEDGDGDQLAGFRPKSVSVLSHTGRGWTQTWQDKDLDFVVAVTASRVVIYCEKFTKGGGWHGFGAGGLMFAGAANLISHARAASRRQGKLLVAQIRYPWLTQVVAADGQGGGKLRLGFSVESASNVETLAVELVVDRRTNALSFGQHIARSATTMRLADGRSLDESQRRLHESVARNPGNGTNPEFPGAWDLPGGIPVGAPGSLPEPAMVSTPGPENGQWWPDPSGRHELRYHDGQEWTHHVSSAGVVASDRESAT